MKMMIRIMMPLMPMMTTMRKVTFGTGKKWRP